MKQRGGPLPSSERTRRRGGRLDRADPAGECRRSHSTGELALRGGDDEDHHGNRSRVTPKGEPVQGSPAAGISLCSPTPRRPQAQTAAMTIREPPAAEAALASLEPSTPEGGFLPT